MLASEVKRVDERKSLYVFPIVPHRHLVFVVRRWQFWLRPKINTTKSIGAKSSLTLSDTNVYYTLTYNSNQFE
jgi:hypothetical protein